MDPINSKNISKISSNSHSQNLKKTKKEVETKQVETSSLNALSNYGKANVSFGGLFNIQSPLAYKKRLNSLMDKLDKDPRFNDLTKDSIKLKANNKTIEFFEQLCLGKDENGNDLFPSKKEIGDIAYLTKKENVEFAKEICFTRNEDGTPVIPNKSVVSILYALTPENTDFARRLCFDKNKDGEDLIQKKESIGLIMRSYNQTNQKIAEILFLGNKDDNVVVDDSSISFILNRVNDYNIDFAKRLLTEKDSHNNFIFADSQYGIPDILEKYIPETKDFIEKICFAQDEEGNQLFPDKFLAYMIIENMNSGNFEFTQKLCFGKDSEGKDYFPEKQYIHELLNACSGYESRIKNAEKLIDLCKQGELTFNMLPVMVQDDNPVTLQQYKALKHIYGEQKIEQMSPDDIRIACKMSPICKKTNINEIDLVKKKELIRSLVAENIALYSISDELKKDFPLVPTNKDEYCTLLRDLTKSIGIETNELEPAQIKHFETNITSLGDSLADLSDEEFNALEFKQEYPKDEFIQNTFDIVKDLTPNERQKVYDYFGFELKHNKGGIQVDANPHHKFSIIGYPVNLNNGKKLSQIQDPNTREIVEKLRPEVIKFSENNHVDCNNKDMEQLVNEILNVCPELRTELDRTQHGTHCFDVFKHSLKVMQKVVQNPNFEEQNDSDKKILLLASLFHDLNKAEGTKDRLHPMESAFDTFYITKKFALSKAEQIKLYSLIKYHEWLGYTNSSSIKTPEDKENRIKSVAYDLHYDNLFELSKIFSEADIKAVKNSDDFFNKNIEVFNTNSQAIESCINELKVSQPLLPVTKIPKASTIKKAITTVNSDGSTNLKGVYQDQNGMLIIKYNEVENETWEKIGFPKNSVSKGISSVNTGNIKWFAHALDYKEQLQNFDAFQLPDSDALLSVSYMELPESKYRLFRPQGVLLDVDTKYQHGGGETDSGSGYKKSLNLFKQEYAYKGSERHADRTYVSDLIKKTLKLNDEEYVEFVKNNANKSLTQIQPKEAQKKLVEAFSSINSNKRKGDRAYNEMYATNPNVMGVFAYSQKDNVGNIMNFIAHQQQFLKEYALEEDLPFIVFGD